MAALDSEPASLKFIPAALPTAVSPPLVAGPPDPAAALPEAPARNASQSPEPARLNRLQARDGHYLLDGQATVLRSAELQYFRIPAEQWPESIDRLRAAGVNAIASYIPWSWHEPEQGRYDFTGRTDPQRDVVRFLTLVRDAGMVFLARPGPFIYAEYQGFGYPRWLAAAIPEALAQRPNGKPAVAPHYELYALLHPDYLRQVHAWYGAVAELLRPFLNDPVIGWQLDNETGMIYAMRLGDVDFNPDTAGRYHAYLREKYGTARRLSRNWGRRVTRVEQVVPPNPTSGHQEMEDWQAFFEHWIAEYLATLRQFVRGLDVDLPLLVNEAAEFLSPQNPRLKAPVGDFYGYDIYTKLSGSGHTADFPFASSLNPLRFQPYAGPARPLTCWELGTGWWDWRAKVAPAATSQVLGAGLAHGMKGYNLYAAQDGRDPGGFAFRIGGLLDEDGQPTGRLDVVARWQTFIAHHEAELAASTEVFDPVVYLDYQPYTRLTPETSFVLPMPGLVEPSRYFTNFALSGFHALLQTTGYNVPYLDLETARLDTPSSATAAIFPSCGSLDLEQYRKLERYVRNGGHLITFPEPVVRRRDGEPLNSGALWPHQPRARRWLGRLRLIAHLIARWMIPYYLGTRWKTARITPGALHLSDLIEPALVGQTATLPGAMLEMVATSAEADDLTSTFNPLRAEGARATAGKKTNGTEIGTIRGDLSLMEFADGGHILLRRGRASAGYRVRVGEGTSTLVGTIPGGAYVTSRYYAYAPEERRALRRFAVTLLDHVVPRRFIPDDDLEVESVARRSPTGGCFLFVINRLGVQSGRLTLARPAELGLASSMQVETLFSAFGSQAGLVPGTNGTLQLDLQPDDVLVLRLR